MITAKEASTLRGAPRLIVSADGKIVSPGPKTASSGSAAHSFGALLWWSIGIVVINDFKMQNQCLRPEPQSIRPEFIRDLVLCTKSNER